MESDDELGVITALFAEMRQVEWLTQLKIDRLTTELSGLIKAVILIELAQFMVMIYEVLHG